MALWDKLMGELVDIVEWLDDSGDTLAYRFERYQNDFYKIDPMLFSPAEVTFVNLTTGRQRTFGKTDGALLTKSFGAS